MGDVHSKNTWRSFPADMNKDTILKYLKDYKPENTNTKHLRILLHGPVGAGKSSFINSVDTIFQGRMTTAALSDALCGGSFTRKYVTYKIRKDSSTFYSFVFNDIMGLESSTGIHVEDLKLILKGHVGEDFKLSAERRITDKDTGYKQTPTLEDRVHVLVSVIPANSISGMSDALVAKMRDVRAAASETGIPQLVVITKIDETSAKTKQDIKHTYRSKQLEEQVELLSKTIGIQPNLIFPVKNYNSENLINPEMDFLILAALKRMVEVGEDFLNKQKEDPTSHGGASTTSLPKNQGLYPVPQ